MIPVLPGLKMPPIISRLETPRLYLELNQAEDPRTLLNFCLSPRNVRLPDILPDSSAVQDLLFYSSPHPPSNYKIVLKETGKKIGLIGFFKWNPEGKSGTIGFSIDKHYRNQGLMTEACLTFLEAWFQEGRMEWIEGKCQPENLESEKVLIKCGMKKKETVQEPLYKGSKIYTLHVYGISRSEWQNLNRR